MAVLDILIWPDAELLKKSVPVEKVDDELRELVDDMLETMYDADGVGLAAPQVGVRKRLVVIDIHGAEADEPSGRAPLVLVNPRFEDLEGELEWEEGCLSVPGETGMVTRAAKATCIYEDLDGNEQRLEAEGLEAVALQHEVDHLEGKLFVEYIGRMKRTVIRRKMLKLIEQRDANAAKV